MRRDLTFRSQCAELAAWLYVPDAPARWPLVIMAHGFSATRGMTADAYAEVFRTSGIAVLSTTIADSATAAASARSARGATASAVASRSRWPASTVA